MFDKILNTPLLIRGVLLIIIDLYYKFLWLSTLIIILFHTECKKALKKIHKRIKVTEMEMAGNSYYDGAKLKI